MVTMKSSSDYTALAIKSFFECTVFEDGDEFLLINNDDGPANYSSIYKKIKVIQNKNSLSFAENVNIGIAVAKKDKKNLVFLNNDIIFTVNWFEPLKKNFDFISIPTNNQLFSYKTDCEKLILKATMKLKDFDENYILLNSIAEKHKKKFNPDQKFQTPLMPFFCFKIPYKILNETGYFDKSFGRGGGEDVDYRIRCAKNGYEVNFVLDSYLLHFHGKSTWDGYETTEETEKRNKTYTKVFLKKWGSDLTQLFILRKNFSNILKEKNLEELFKKGKFGDLIRKLL